MKFPLSRLLHQASRIVIRFVLATTLPLTMSNCDDKPAPATNTVTGGPKLEGPVTYSLDDAEVRHSEAPETFKIPDKESRHSLGAGDAVKLIFEITDGRRTEVERMWVLITKKNGDAYEGELDNDPYCTDQLKSGVTIAFEPRHIIQIETDEAPPNE